MMAWRTKKIKLEFRADEGEELDDDILAQEGYGAL
jgi:hypothetical protein